MSDEHRDFEVRQEPDTIAWRRVLVGAGIAAAIAVTMAVAGVLIPASRQDELRPSGVFPEANLGPRRDLMGVHQDLFIGRGLGQVLDEQKQRELTRFGWVDRDRKVVRIPIDEAMNLLVEEGKR